MRRVVRCLLLLAVLVTPFTVGCWDRTEVNDIAIVVASALDIEPDGKYRVSVQLPLPGQMGGATGGGGGTSGSKSYYVDTEVGRTVREAKELLQRRLSRRLFFSHRRVFVIGEELAKQGITKLFDDLSRGPENRLTATMVVAKGKGIELLNAQPNFERYSAEAMREILGSDNVLNISMKDVGQMLSRSGVDPVIAYMSPVTTTGGAEKSTDVRIIGYAQFHTDKMVNVLKGAAAEGLSWIKQKFHPYITTVETDKGEEYTVKIFQGNTKIIPKLMAGHVHFDMKVEATAAVLEATSQIDLGRLGNSIEIELEIGKHIRSAIEDVIHEMKTQEADSAALGLLIFRRYPLLWQNKYRSDWYQELQKATFAIKVDADLSRIGLTSENLAKREVSR